MIGTAADRTNQVSNSSKTAKALGYERCYLFANVLIQLL